MITIKTFNNRDIKKIHAAWQEAFCDYPVQIEMPLDRLKKMFLRRGAKLELSYGAYAEGQLVGFMINGLRLFNGHLTAYDTATAIVPAFRKQGISKKLFSESVQILKQHKAEFYLLEVLIENRPAVRLYQKTGFEITRSFICLEGVPAASNIPPAAYTCQKKPVLEISEAEWTLFQCFADSHSAWQNSKDSILAAAKELLCLSIKKAGQIIGCAIIAQNGTDVPFLAISPAHRRQKAGTHLLDRISALSNGGKITLLNIDESNQGLLGFLKKQGLTESVRQYEMIKKL